MKILHNWKVFDINTHAGMVFQSLMHITSVMWEIIDTLYLILFDWTLQCLLKRYLAILEKL